MRVKKERKKERPYWQTSRPIEFGLVTKAATRSRLSYLSLFSLLYSIQNVCPDSDGSQQSSGLQVINSILYVSIFEWDVCTQRMSVQMITGRRNGSRGCEDLCLVLHMNKAISDEIQKKSVWMWTSCTTVQRKRGTEWRKCSKVARPPWNLSLLIWRGNLFNSDPAVLIIHWAGGAGYLDSYLSTHTKGNPQSSKWTTSPESADPSAIFPTELMKAFIFDWFFFIYYFLQGKRGKVLPWLLSSSFLSFSLYPTLTASPSHSTLRANNSCNIHSCSLTGRAFWNYTVSWSHCADAVQRGSH